MTTAQVVKMSVTVNNNSPIQDYVHPDDQTQPLELLLLTAADVSTTCAIVTFRVKVPGQFMVLNSGY